MSQNTQLDDLLSRVPVAELAGRFGVDEATVEAAVRQTLPGLVGGLAVNASEAEGAEKLEKALEKHGAGEAKPTLKGIDTEDGTKIVTHVLGDRRDSVAHALGAQSGNSAIADLIPKLLPILAPLVLQFLAGRVGGGAASSTSGSASAGGEAGVGGVLGDLLGGLLGGGSNGGAAQSSGGDLGGVLGGLLGGGSGSSGGGLGDLLGGLLGGK
ncbi:DUF937 domain-containing protein [Leucobacter weissii]|uniref:DUF937 domain-containing protein n=1 Tax=Leucobacter weissii TaxID=1983706 RepID=A0A939MGW8_9MICO|nr:DUF937 domain-containing protein [Leucobacter weissii]MBO1900689.1 DUF937 domain-containing protein [Leucobacter weissii]